MTRVSVNNILQLQAWASLLCRKTEKKMRKHRDKELSISQVTDAYFKSEFWNKSFYSQSCKYSACAHAFVVSEVKVQACEKEEGNFNEQGPS